MIKLRPNLINNLVKNQVKSNYSTVGGFRRNLNNNDNNTISDVLPKEKERKRLQPLNYYGVPIDLDEFKVNSKKLPKATTSTLRPRRKKSIPIESVDVVQEDVQQDGEDSGQSIEAILSMPMLEASIRRNLARYPEALLLTQVGSFFESYFDQAPIVAKELHIKLTSKSFGKGDAKKQRSFCGFPLKQLSKHVSTLVEKGYKVVVVEEFREATSNSDNVKSLGDIGRNITRIVTAGTGVDEGFVRKEETNYVLAVGISEGSEEIGLAYRDISTGTSFIKTSNVTQLRDDIALIEPKEVVLDIQIDSSSLGSKILKIIKGEEARESWMVSMTSNSTTPVINQSPNYSAETLLRSYLAENLLATPPPNTMSTFVDPQKVMALDSTTLKSLEIKISLRGGVSGSLLSTVRRTVTPGGGRLLAERLCAPSIEINEIDERLAIVSSLSLHSGTRQYLRALLKSFDDTPRILQRLFMRRGNAFDLISLKKFIVGVEGIRKTLEDAIEDDYFEDKDSMAVINLMEKMVDHTVLAQIIEDAIDEEALIQMTAEEERKAAIADHLGANAAEKSEDEAEEKSEVSKGLWGKNEKWMVRPQFTETLEELHSNLRKLRSTADGFETSLREKFSIASLTLKFYPKRGAIIYVKGSKVTALDSDKNFIFIGGTGSTKMYLSSKWSELHNQIESTNIKIRLLETNTAQNLVAKVLEQFNSLQQTADVVSELDVHLGFAELAREMDLVRPVINESKSISIVDGRHPTVERALKLQGRTFITNSLQMSHPQAFIHILTGPNMAGKSTYLRSMALIAILAQSGSFVPASSAELGVIDRIFSRVGARDELDRDKSTFMVEMDECSSILLNATDRSLVLLDELGRGTSPVDGLSISYAALEHLIQINKSKTLFATHYHLLGEAIGCDNNNTIGSGIWEGVEFWCTEMQEQEDSVTYLHTVKRGLNSDSGGIVVARLAGMPIRAIKVAEELRTKFINR